MTAEVLVMNRTGIALAADSAITIGSGRVWKSSNKLFHLSSESDVGVMFYGAGDYCGLPWEVLLKEFRKSLCGKKFDFLTDYADEFVEYLKKIDLTDDHISRHTARSIITDLISNCLQELPSGKVTQKRKALSDAAAIINREIEIHLDERIAGITKKQFSTCYRSDIEDLLRDMCDFVPNKRNVDSIEELCKTALSRNYASTYNTGIVFAGFGERELLPVMAAIMVDGCLFLKPRVWSFKYIDMNNNDSSAPSYVFSFAQSDMAHAFMEGVSQDVVTWISEAIAVLLRQKSQALIEAYVPTNNQTVERHLQRKADDALVDGFSKEFEDFRLENTSNKMLNVVASLPKEEMSAMAEAIVEITSLRRKMDSSLESVGGPVDVAVVSKADGFIWIKRKHYFDIDLNKDFLERRTARFSGR